MSGIPSSVLRGPTKEELELMTFIDPANRRRVIHIHTLFTTIPPDEGLRLAPRIGNQLERSIAIGCVARNILGKKEDRSEYVKQLFAVCDLEHFAGILAYLKGSDQITGLEIAINRILSSPEPLPHLRALIQKIGPETFQFVAVSTIIRMIFEKEELNVSLALSVVNFIGSPILRFTRGIREIVYYAMELYRAPTFNIERCLRVIDSFENPEDVSFSCEYCVRKLLEQEVIDEASCKRFFDRIILQQYRSATAKCLAEKAISQNNLEEAARWLGYVTLSSEKDHVLQALVTTLLSSRSTSGSDLEKIIEFSSQIEDSVTQQNIIERIYETLRTKADEDRSLCSRFISLIPRGPFRQVVGKYMCHKLLSLERCDLEEILLILNNLFLEKEITKTLFEKVWEALTREFGSNESAKFGYIQRIEHADLRSLFLRRIFDRVITTPSIDYHFALTVAYTTTFEGDIDLFLEKILRALIDSPTSSIEHLEAALIQIKNQSFRCRYLPLVIKKMADQRAGIKEMLQLISFFKEDEGVSEALRVIIDTVALKMPYYDLELTSSLLERLPSKKDQDEVKILMIRASVNDLRGPQLRTAQDILKSIDSEALKKEAVKIIDAACRKKGLGAFSR